MVYFAQEDHGFIVGEGRLPTAPDQRQGTPERRVVVDRCPIALCVVWAENAEFGIGQSCMLGPTSYIWVSVFVGVGGKHLKITLW